MPYEFKKNELIAKDTGKVYHTDNPHKLAKQHEYFANKKGSDNMYEEEREKKDNTEETKENEEKPHDGEKHEEREEEHAPDEETKDWEKEYHKLYKEHDDLKREREGEKRTKERSESFEKHGLHEENYKLYHRLLDKSEDTDKDMEELKKENPHHFGKKGTNINKSLPEKDHTKEETKEIDHAKLGMLG